MKHIFTTVAINKIHNYRLFVTLNKYQGILKLLNNKFSKLGAN